MSDVTVSRKQLEQMMVRQSIITLDRQGYKPGRIARELHVARSTVHKWINRGSSDGPPVDAPRKGRPRRVKPHHKGKIVAMMKGKERTSVRKVAAVLEGKNVLTVSRETVRKVAHEAGLEPLGRPAKPLQKKGNKLKRRKFCQRYRATDWSSVLFVDEATFMCYATPNKSHDVVWWPCGTTRKPYPTVAHGAKVHVFGGFSASGMRVLHLFTERFTAKKYVEILDAELKPAIARDGQPSLYLSDNSPIHKAKVAQAWLRANIPQYIPPKHWPGYSPDLNPIENAWARLKHEVAMSQPTNDTSLREAIENAWNSMMTPSYCTELAESMNQRITACVAANGGPTKY